MASSASPLLSIVIPTYNRDWCVGRAIESAIAQTAPDIEIIVSNNGSRDHTRDVIARYSDPRMRVIHRNITVSAAQHGNLLRQECKGKFFVGLSDDDYLEPEFSSEVIEVIKHYPEIPFIYTACNIHFEDVSVPGFHGPEFESNLDFIEGFFSGRREAYWCSCVTKLSYLLDIGDQPDFIQMGDLYYWMKVVFRTKAMVACIQKPLAHYTLMSDNISRTVPVYNWAAELRLHADAAIEEFVKRADVERVDRIKRKASTCVANACADQIIWNVLANVPKRTLVRDAMESARFWSHESVTWPRIAFGLVATPSLVRRFIFAAARRRATTGRMIWEDMQKALHRFRFLI